MFILTFSVFLRSSELCLIRSRHIQFSTDFVTLYIEKSKTDKLREGRSVVIAESGSATCPCTLLRCTCWRPSYLRIWTSIFFRQITSSRNQKRLDSVNKSISYSAYRESFKKSFSNIVPDISKFSTLPLDRAELMVSLLDSGSSGPGSSPGRGCCVVFLGKTRYSHSASLHPGVPRTRARSIQEYKWVLAVRAS